MIVLAYNLFNPLKAFPSFFYHKESEAGIIYNDPELNIDWKVPPAKIMISDKDLELPPLSDCINNFEFEG